MFQPHAGWGRHNPLNAEKKYQEPSRAHQDITASPRIPRGGESFPFRNYPRIPESSPVKFTPPPCTRPACRAGVVLQVSKVVDTPFVYLIQALFYGVHYCTEVKVSLVLVMAGVLVVTTSGLRLLRATPEASHGTGGGTHALRVEAVQGASGTCEEWQ